MSKCFTKEDLELVKEDDIDKIQDIVDNKEYPVEDFVGGWVPYWVEGWSDAPYGITKKNLEKLDKCELLTTLINSLP
jgi:hypothetical protein